MIQKSARTRNVGTKFRAAIGSLIAVATIQLLGCNDPIASQKNSCGRYVQDGYLAANETEDCLVDINVFRAAAQKSIIRPGETILSHLLIAQERLGANAAQYDKTKHQKWENSRGTLIGGLLLDDDADKEWRYFIDLENVTISPPRQTEDGLDPDWKISGRRASTPDDFWSLPIFGVGSYALTEAEICDILEYTRENRGCRARIYLDKMDVNEGISELGVMAVDFQAPSLEDIQGALLEIEMLGWRQKKR
jgi:hypothetical protein